MPETAVPPTSTQTLSGYLKFNTAFKRSREFIIQTLFTAICYKYFLKKSNVLFSAHL